MIGENEIEDEGAIEIIDMLKGHKVSIEIDISN